MRKIPTWSEYWQGQVSPISTRSKDPSTQVGCIIVDKHNEQISAGYNGFPTACDESKLTWDRPMKYYLVVHAEMNALLRVKDRSALRDGAKAYVTDAPCENCLKHMLTVGIREIYYRTPEIMWKRSSPEQKLAIKMLIESTNAIVVNFETGLDIVTDINKPIPEETK